MHRTKSHGYATDLMIASLDGEVRHGNGYLAARTPSCPDFWWGNFVLFAAPPRADSVAAWEAVFDEEVATIPEVAHRNFAWDSINGDHGAAGVFVEQGYALSKGVFSMTQATHPAPHHRNDTLIRPLQSDRDWQRALEIQQASISATQGTPRFRAFQARQQQRSRRLVALGAGEWFGAFVQSVMVATMGLIVHRGVGRCQTVATAPEARQSGFCRTLLHSVCTYGFEQMGAREIGIMTDADNPALRVYRSVGFEVREHLSSLQLSQTDPCETRGAERRLT